MIGSVAASTLIAGSPGQGSARQGRSSSVAEPRRRAERQKQRERGSNSRAARRASQRERLLASIIELAIESSPNDVTVAEIVALAGVSRPTFYEYFTDREDCFLQALDPGAQELLSALERAVASSPPQRAPGAAAGALVDFARSAPGIARLLTSDSLAGGRAALNARDRLIDRAAQAIQRTVDGATKDTMVPAISPRLLLGVASRLLAVRLDRGEESLAGLDGELRAWLDCYSLPASASREQARSAVSDPSPTPLLSARLRPPRALSYVPGRMPDGALGENQRLRIVFATAATVARDGYAAATVAEIVRVAGLDSRAFYRLFTCKEEALGEAREMMFGHAMALTAGAFATADSWPERVWEAARAFTDCVEQNPTLAYVSFVESHAGGPVAMARLPEPIGAFTIFLQEGYRYASPQPGSSRAPSSLALEATVTAVFELFHLYARRSGTAPAPHPDELAFICLAPFLDAERTNAILERRRTAEDCTREPAGSGALPSTASHSPAAHR
jgi:AcrR family transcriptional regulator